MAYIYAHTSNAYVYTAAYLLCKLYVQPADQSNWSHVTQTLEFGIIHHFNYLELTYLQ